MTPELGFPVEASDVVVGYFVNQSRGVQRDTGTVKREARALHSISVGSISLGNSLWIGLRIIIEISDRKQ